VREAGQLAGGARQSPLSHPPTSVMESVIRAVESVIWRVEKCDLRGLCLSHGPKSVIRALVDATLPGPSPAVIRRAPRRSSNHESHYLD
jgi:hypothetical protein